MNSFPPKSASLDLKRSFSNQVSVDEQYTDIRDQSIADFYPSQRGKRLQKSILELYKINAQQIKRQTRFLNLRRQRKRVIRQLILTIQKQIQRLEERFLQLSLQLQKEEVLLSNLKKGHLTQMLMNCQDKINENRELLKQQKDDYDQTDNQCESTMKKLQKLELEHKNLLLKLRKIRNDCRI